MAVVATVVQATVLVARSATITLSNYCLQFTLLSNVYEPT